MYVLLAGVLFALGNTVLSTPYYGIPLGELKNADGDVLARVWLANETVIQFTDANIPCNAL